METEPLQIRLAVRELVEFVLRRGSTIAAFPALTAQRGKPYPPQAAKSGGRFL